ncbi:Uncharacterized membrane protein YGL010W [Gillisia sp. Hel1_33_143]|uniref:Mpo1 family 2-hydroxy fatty acid dioxygenase n=1 Tax=Gillisia sp. Hel1_33_143 TaxID=1336796 RepID=UPI00087C1BC6|nr:Mpo1-like protein [Gillisia sp. Hel1_33_143]SDS25212.1 Uncharacterized membrane protein YGL010W [Gillisia sp. Hel1_33_143]
MKRLNEWFEEYSVSHQNQTNQYIHYICVPAIFLSIAGLFMCIPVYFLEDLLKGDHPVFENWALVVFIFVLIFYFSLSVKMGLMMAVFGFLCLVINYLISLIAPLWIVSLTIFVLAWIGQFYGHKIEGKKPSFLKDLQFLLIGPAWVLYKLFK